MADIVFIQRSWVASQLYQLGDEQLLITHGYFGWTTTHEFSLRKISLDYQRRGQRSTATIVISFLGTALCLGLAVFFLQMEDGPKMLAGYPAMAGLGCLSVALRGVRRLDCFIFSDHRNQPLFALIRDPVQTEEFDAFINELLDRLERIEKGLPAEEPGRSVAPPPSSAVTLPSAEGPEDRRNAIPRWVLSIGAGVVASSYPWLAKAIPEMGDIVLLFPIVFLSSVLSTWWCLRSYLDKESPRHRALLGLALAWLPWALY